MTGAVVSGCSALLSLLLSAESELLSATLSEDCVEESEVDVSPPQDAAETVKPQTSKNASNDLNLLSFILIFLQNKISLYEFYRFLKSIDKGKHRHFCRLCLIRLHEMRHVGYLYTFSADIVAVAIHKDECHGDAFSFVDRSFRRLKEREGQEYFAGISVRTESRRRGDMGASRRNRGIRPAFHHRIAGIP